MVHERYNSGTVLITLLNYVHKGLRLHLTLVLSDCHSDVSFLCTPFTGRNLLAQSWISSTLLSLRQSMQSVRVASWFKSRSWCDFKTWIARTASWKVCIASSLPYSCSSWFLWIAILISLSISLRSWQRQRKKWSCQQLLLKDGSVESLRAHWVKWSACATQEQLETLTCLIRKGTYILDQFSI